MQFPARLIFCNGFEHCFIHYLPKYSLFCFLFFAGFSRCHFLVFLLSFWPRNLLLFVLQFIVGCYAMLICSFCVLTTFFDIIFCSFVGLLFLIICGLR